jgi:hypothetical protein
MTHGEEYRRGGLDPVQDARTGSAGAREDRVLGRIDPARPTRRQEMNGSSPGIAPKSQVPTFTYDFPRRHQWPGE